MQPPAHRSYYITKDHISLFVSCCLFFGPSSLDLVLVILSQANAPPPYIDRYKVYLQLRETISQPQQRRRDRQEYDNRIIKLANPLFSPPLQSYSYDRAISVTLTQNHTRSFAIIDSSIFSARFDSCTIFRYFYPISRISQGTRILTNTHETTALNRVDGLRRDTSARRALILRRRARPSALHQNDTATARTSIVVEKRHVTRASRWVLHKCTRAAPIIRSLHFLYYNLRRYFHNIGSQVYVKCIRPIRKITVTEI